MTEFLNRDEEVRRDFVNRGEELSLIEDAVNILNNRDRLLRTPLIEFYGVDGIGKTALLKKVEEKCRDKQVRCVWEDLRQSSGISNQFFEKTKELLKEKGPVVVLLDSLDVVYENELPDIEKGLSELTEYSNLFVILASRRIEKFDNTRSLARKLTIVPLQPFNQESCELYLNKIASDIRPEVRTIIYEWTRGYPLAMSVMVKAILKENLDPARERDQRRLIVILTKEVIDRVVLSKVDDIPWYQTVLSLLSVPRRFNLVTIQEIIEEYAPRDYKLPSSLAYITLPDRINKATNLLSWNMRQGGYSIDPSARNIFLLQLKITRPQQYFDMHRFLAEINLRNAGQVSGPDHVRYLREYFYHLANSGETANLSSILREHIEALIQREPFDSFIQFYEEFSQDEELKEALGDNSKVVFSLLHRHLAQKYMQLAETSELDRLDNLQKFLFHTVHDPDVKNVLPIFEQEMQRVKQMVSSEEYDRLIEDLSHDERFESLLRGNFDTLSQ